MGSITAACLILGAITVTATIRLNRGPEEAHKIPAAATEDYGRRLLAQTPEYLGPDVADPKMRYISSRLSCGSCHLGTGAEPGTLSLPESIHHYPRFAARYGATTTIEDRVNECMQRSMNGKPLPKNSTEMIAITAYIKSLGVEDAASAPARKKADEPRASKLRTGRRTSPPASVSSKRSAPPAIRRTGPAFSPPPTRSMAMSSRRYGGRIPSTAGPACTGS